jgi:hypothetical protein
MRLNLILSFVFAITLVSLVFSSHLRAAGDSCAVIQEALVETDKLKAGMTRDKVEGSFILDGGLQFRRTSRYSFRKCPSIKVNVDFSEQGPADSSGFSAKDEILKVSQPYLQYPAYD